MAIAFDTAVAAQNFGTAATTLTWSHTVTGTNPTLFVGFGQFNAADTITSVTYNGVAMSLKVVVNDGANGGGAKWLYMYALPNCATGANSIVVTSSSVMNIAAVSASYTGTNTVSQPDGTNSLISTSNVTTDTAVSLTTASAGSWGVMFTASGRSVLVGTGSTVRATNSNAQSALLDSTSAFGSTGANSINYKSNATGGVNATTVIVGIKAAAATSTQEERSTRPPTNIFYTPASVIVTK